MRLVLDRRAQRLLRRLPRSTLYSAAELLLLSLLAIQCARLIFAAATPVGPLGGWRSNSAPADMAGASSAIFGIFDPFFRLSAAAGPAVVTGLDIKLFGIRADQASGRGSAIVALPDGTQASYSVGEEILPGVILKSVAFDNVMILRGGVEERLYLDQSEPAAVISAPPAAASVTTASLDPFAAAATGGAVTPAALASETQMIPRIANGTVTGLTLQPRGSGEAFRAAGLQPGDILVAVNGTRVANAEAAERFEQQLGQGGAATIEVERGGRIVALRVQVGQ